MVSTRLARAHTLMLHRAENMQAVPPTACLRLPPGEASGRLLPSEVVCARGRLWSLFNYVLKISRTCVRLSGGETWIAKWSLLLGIPFNKLPVGIWSLKHPDWEAEYYQNPQTSLMFLSSDSRLSAAWNSFFLYNLEVKEQLGHVLVSFEPVPLGFRRCLIFTWGASAKMQTAGKVPFAPNGNLYGPSSEGANFLSWFHFEIPHEAFRKIFPDCTISGNQYLFSECLWMCIRLLQPLLDR